MGNRLPAHRPRAAIGALGVIGLLTCFSAGCASPRVQDRDVDPEADAVLRRMCSTLDGAKACRLHVRAALDRRIDTGQLAQFRRESRITLSRPNRLFAVTDSDDGAWSAWYLGGALTVLDRDDNRYATEPIPGDIAAMCDHMAEQYDVIMPMADLLVGETYDTLVANAETGEYVGLHSVGDVRCHHLLFHQDNLDWQIWIDAGTPPLPLKLVITYTTHPDHPQYVATIDEWNLAPDCDDDTFKFSPPSGATSVTMSELVAQNRGELP